MTVLPLVRRVLGDGPFAEMGLPCLAVVDGRSRRIAVAGDVGRLQWSGSGTADSRWTGDRIGVYDRDTLRCEHLVRSRYPVNCSAFHPTLPLLAVGTGCYDGGYAFEGELLLLHLDTGTVVSALRYGREVLGVEWCGPTRLRLVLAPSDDWENDDAHEQGHEAMVSRDDWGAVGSGNIEPEELSAPVRPAPRPDHRAETGRLLADLAAGAGRRWHPRRRVWAVEGREDGRVLAALDGVLAESWSPSGEREWVVEDDEGGRQLVPAADGISVWANGDRRMRRGDGGWERPAPRIARVAVGTGQVLETLSLAESAVLVAGGGRVLVRPSDHTHRRGERLTMFGLADRAEAQDADGSEARRRPLPEAGTFEPTTHAFGEVGGFDLFNHPFPVSRASRPYVLVGTRPDAPHKDKWIVALAADGTTRRLFPLSWVPEEHHFGGPAAEIGQSLVYAGAVHDGAGLQPGGAYVVRRSLDGAVTWQHRTDHPATALDVDEDTVYVAYNSGALTALDADDGTVRWHTELAVDGTPTTALSLAVAPDGNLLIGTVDGRILEYAVRP
ncbi:PQQ-binding-like beta-propeller repeat protein [Streptomyces sp. NPDC002667]|uniref:outer membrane protein assembly factor BamB family protein n=1 Tax=Streptomyces sp. NPDC002667 TaxID=3364657 RepID=UPI0036AC8884